jgi:hypothetical protein
MVLRRQLSRRVSIDVTQYPLSIHSDLRMVGQVGGLGMGTRAGGGVPRQAFVVCVWVWWCGGGGGGGDRLP